MKKLLNMGDMYVSNFVKDTTKELSKYSLDLILDEELKCPRLKEVAPASDMWGEYWYRSGINQSMVNQLKVISNEICSRIKYKKNDIWLDIACNDGVMFDYIPYEFIKLGIDPADDTFYEESSKRSHAIVQDFFNYDSYNKTGYGDKKCKVITTIAMFYDLDDPNPFIEDINKILDDDGVWVIQLSYTPLMVKQMAFDNICHEHVYYYSLNSLNKLFNKHDLKIVDCQLNDTNGGSCRVYVQKNKANIESFGTSPLRDVCNYRINSILEYENNKVDISDISLWEEFSRNMDDLKSTTVDFIEKEVSRGKSVYGYGASTKGNTLLQYFGLNSSHITAIAEKSKYKFGLKTVGSDIPIISEDEMRRNNPDYLLVLPWHFIGFFVNREKEFLNNGGKFIVPCPKFEIIGG
jgi:NDP-4-keto-2,6-dideoxyhexose 3-C-methyltransferase